MPADLTPVTYLSLVTDAGADSQPVTGEVLPAVAQLDAEAARARTEAVRADLRHALAWAHRVAQGLTEARRLHDDVALGYPSWHAYLEGEYGDLHALVPHMPTEERLHLVASLSQSEQLSTREAAARTGLSASTVSSLRRAAKAAGMDLPDQVRSRDGALRPATRTAPAPAEVTEPEGPEPAKTVTVLALLAACGGAGMTVKELVGVTGWSQSEASATLTRLDKTNRVAYRRPAKRGQLGVYLALAHSGLALTPAAGA